ncbi:hypothetical protein BH24ACT15_BH24ACT15_25160 [soil metagenome]
MALPSTGARLPSTVSRGEPADPLNRETQVRRGAEESRSVSRILSRTTIYLGPSLPLVSCGLPGAWRVTSMHLLGLAPDGGLPGRRRRRLRRCALTAPFHPYPYRSRPFRNEIRPLAVYSLLHLPRIAAPGSYPASYPVESGLSSTCGAHAAAVRPTLLSPTTVRSVRPGSHSRPLVTTGGTPGRRPLDAQAARGGHTWRYPYHRRRLRPGTA